MTTVHGVAVLSNVDALELAGFATQPFLDALGETRDTLASGARVEWDRFASLFDQAVDAIGDEALLEATRQIPDFIRERDPSGPTFDSQRAALTFLADGLGPQLWSPLRFSIADRGSGFAIFSVEIPEPLRRARGFLVGSLSGIEAFPRFAGLPEVRVLDMHVTGDGRRADYFVELTDEHVPVPAGPLGDAILGPAVMATLDIAELAGVDTAAWLAEHGLHRDGLVSGGSVRWNEFLELLDATVRVVGAEGTVQAFRSFAALTGGVAPLLEGLPDLEAIYSFLHGHAVEPFWGPVAPIVVRGIRPSVLCVRVPLRVGVQGSESFFVAEVGTLEALPAHRGLPFASVRRTWLDPGATGATYVVDLPDEGAVGDLARVSCADADARDPGLAESIVVEVSRRRHAARARVVERIGRELATAVDVQTIADVVAEGLMTALELEGLEIDLPAEGDDVVPLRLRGAQAGASLTRVLEHGGRTVGRVTVWTTATMAGEALSALDLLGPWVAVAFGTALAAARERRARLAAEASRDGLEQTLDDVLSAHPHPAYVMSDDGHVVAANDQARAQLDANAAATLSRIARAVGEPDQPFDVLPVRIGERIDRIVVIERIGKRSFDERLSAIADEHALTPRQRRVFGCVARGMSNKEIANELDCAEVTVETHLTAIYRKVGVDGRGRLVARLAD